MTPEEQELKAFYEKEGVEMPPEPKTEGEEAKPETPAAPEAEKPKDEPTKPEDPEPLQPEPNPEPRKRSIYQDLKDTRKEVKTERELREQAERERDELRQKLEAVNAAKTPEERKDAADDLDAFAQEVGANPEALRKMREVFLKGITPAPAVDPAAIEEFRQWREQNSKAIEQQEFEREFASVQGQFAAASAEELSLIKQKLDELAHTPQFHDKELDYVIFKNKSSLDALISPKKRGIESKGRVDATAPTFEFDPNADISKMSPEEFAKWEQAYKAATKHDELIVDPEGRRVMI